MSITVKDVADMVERVDEKLSPLTRAAYSFQKINQNRIFTSEVNQNEEADQ